jgi:hypothetical protein
MISYCDPKRSRAPVPYRCRKCEIFHTLRFPKALVFSARNRKYCWNRLDGVVSVVHSLTCILDVKISTTYPRAPIVTRCMWFVRLILVLKEDLHFWSYEPNYNWSSNVLNFPTAPRVDTHKIVAIYPMTKLSAFDTVLKSYLSTVCNTLPVRTTWN